VAGSVRLNDTEPNKPYQMPALFELLNDLLPGFGFVEGTGLMS
jgi:hypothetical protein